MPKKKMLVRKKLQNERLTQETPFAFQFLSPGSHHFLSERELLVFLTHVTVFFRNVRHTHSGEWPTFCYQQNESDISVNDFDNFPIAFCARACVCVAFGGYV